jgi:phosphoserine aminotransferase
VNRRIYNFGAGPATLPLEVLQEAQEELLDYRDTGMSILEMSHRSKEYEAINAEAETNMKELLGIGADYRVLFLQGGASTQFSMVPMNFLQADRTADYILTGSWAEKACKEAKLFGHTHIAASTAETNYKRIPDHTEIRLSENPAYVHLTSNNTIFGTQWQQFPDVGKVPLIADMSSDILSRSFDASRFSFIYAGAQKNLGPAGVTIVILREELLEGGFKTVPTMLRYDIHGKNNSLYNTPPVFAVYLVNLVLRRLKANGGLAEAEKRNRQKAALVYQAIDGSSGFYRGHAAADSRSLMNITFRLPNEELEQRFIRQAEDAGMKGVKGHRSVGGLRVSIYNAMELKACHTLHTFMVEFAQKNG